MFAFIGLTVAMFMGLVFFSAYMRREEIAANWSKYRDDPFFIFAAPLFKPDDDPRSRAKFAADNFGEVLNGLLNKVFAVFLAPLMKIFTLLGSSVEESAKGLFNMRTLLGNMYKKFSSITDIFTRRFYNVFHSLRMTFLKLFSSMQKTYALSVSSVFAGISAYLALNNSFYFMMTVVIVILVILVVLVIFFFFLLAPALPVILSVIAIISATAIGGAVGGMSSTFCFAEGTQVRMADGPTPIQSVKLGDTTETGATVVGTMMFDTPAEDLYNLHGVIVSASHIVYEEGAPIHVQDHPDAFKVPYAQNSRLYCLITTDHHIPVVGNAGTLDFADWEEIDATCDLEAWNAYVQATLNSTQRPQKATSAQLNSEAAFTGKTRIWTPVGPAEIRGIHPGSIIVDADGNPTRVNGVVRLAASEIAGAVKLDTGAYASAGAWMQTNGVWKQQETMEVPVEETWYSIFTESGTFRLCCGQHIGTPVRDFTDVGPEQIADTYEWVLRTLAEHMAEEPANTNLEAHLRECPPVLHSY